jgi:ATP-dependent helicase/nuclease subunit A
MSGDADARRRIATEFDTTFFVEAAAGTGKTTALVRRIVALVRAGVTKLDRIVAVTFTEKAAGETKLRLRAEIETARSTAGAPERARLDQALEALELTRIGTIHAFCTDLLHERPVEAGIDPLFAVAGQPDAQMLADETFDRWFEAILADPPEGVRRILRRRSGRASAREQLRDAMASLRDHRDFPQPWRRDAFDRNAVIDSLMTELAGVGALVTSASASDSLVGNLAAIDAFVAEATRLEIVRPRDYDGIEAALQQLPRAYGWSYRGQRRTSFGDLTRDQVLERRDRAKARLDAFNAASGADLAPLLHQALQEPIADYERLKAETGRLDFLDLLIKTRDLIRDERAVRAELQQRFTHFFIDEFQDTDPLQVEILLLLAAHDPAETDWRQTRPVPGKLFLVGDPKQSIYRFRRADIAIYEDVKARLLEAGATLLHLSRSFRAPPSIQAFVNGAFAPVMTASADRAQADYVALEAARDEITGRPTLVALPVPAPYSAAGNITNKAIDDTFPATVGAFIRWLVEESGWRVEENGEAVPIRPRHITILFRRLRNYVDDVTRGYVRALEARGLPHVLVGGRSFHDTEEVIALRTALTAIEWPDDELSVYAMLRGPLFALSDEALLLFRQFADETGALRTRRLHPVRSLDRDSLDPAAIPVAEALDVLRQLHRGRNQRPIAQTVAMLLEAVRAPAGIALWDHGGQALANCQRLVDMARQFERTASSFRAFVERLQADAEHGEADEAPIVEEGTEGVRLMTVHKAKGLEFPVVILADPSCPATHGSPSRHVDGARQLWVETLCDLVPVELRDAEAEELRREDAEAVRLAYVAATRARDLLIMPVCGDQRLEAWLGTLEPMLYPQRDRGISRAALGCPKFGSDSVLDRGPKGAIPPGGPVSPGLHWPVAGGPPVVWWDPSILALDADEPIPLRLQHILRDDDAGAAAASEAAYEAWQERRGMVRAQASRPSLAVSSVTNLASAASPVSDDHGDASAPGSAVTVELLEGRDQERPGGRRFGALVHAILASIDLNARAGQVERVAVLQQRMVDATTVERDAAVTAVTRALCHPVLRAAAKATQVRRETPVFLTLEDGSLAEGVVDLAFREARNGFEGWTVVDFKTDGEFSAEAERYRRQVALYARAVQAATGLPTRGLLLVI